MVQQVSLAAISLFKDVANDGNEEGRSKHEPGIESLKRAAISRPPRGRGGAAVSSRREASLTSTDGEGIERDNNVVERR